ncbi:MAG TPA: OmpA family protein, partial [Tenuifilum sp.]|nr:OmpA family protein [Tenuifilum sp.]
PKLKINGSTADSVSIDPVTGEFKVRLPFGKKYVTAIESKDYNPLDNQLDLTGYVEFTQVKHEVYAERKDANMAILSGKVINLKTGQPLEKEVPVKLKVNGTETRGFIYDSTSASYTLKLPVGVSYDVLPSVKNFYNKYEQVDLTKVKKGTKIAKNFYVTPIEVGQSVNIDFIYFDVGKATLKPQSFRSLNALVEFLNEYPNVIVEIGGHTDNTGSAVVNQRLSDARAKSVADYIIKMGIPKDRITSKGYGPSKPKASNATAKGRAENRRVEFTIVGI